MAVVVLIGLLVDRRIAIENLRTTGVGRDSEVTSVSEVSEMEVVAGQWLRAHISPDAVVMARGSSTVHHYSERKLVWFPPVSDAQVLFEGMMRHRVDYVVVIRHSSPYFLPDDGECFDRLFARYGDGFRLVFEKENLRIFRFNRDAFQKKATSGTAAS